VLAPDELCCPIERMYVIYDFLTGDKLFTTNCRELFGLAKNGSNSSVLGSVKLNEKDCTTDNWREWLAAAESK